MSVTETIQYRSVPFELLEVRDDGADGRSLVGVFVPYGVDQAITPSLTERFEPGCFAHQVRAADRVKLWAKHSIERDSLVLGRTTELTDQSDGLHGVARIMARGNIAEHWLSLVTEGVLTQWSIGFVPRKQHREGDVIVRTKADLSEIALVPEGAYGDSARVLSVRNVLETPNLDRWKPRLAEIDRARGMSPERVT